MVICPTGKAENIFDQDWTGKISLKCFSKFDFPRTCLGAEFRGARRCLQGGRR
jgi:hypothetical protein